MTEFEKRIHRIENAVYENSCESIDIIEDDDGFYATVIINPYEEEIKND